MNSLDENLARTHVGIGLETSRSSSVCSFLVTVFLFTQLWRKLMAIHDFLTLAKVMKRVPQAELRQLVTVKWQHRRHENISVKSMHSLLWRRRIIL